MTDPTETARMLRTYTLDVQGTTYTLTEQEKQAIFASLIEQAVAQERAWKDEQRAAGQVWVVHYARHHHPYQEECFSFEDAVGFARSGTDAGSMVAGSVVTPGGEVLTGDWWREHGSDDD